MIMNHFNGVLGSINYIDSYVHQTFQRSIHHDDDQTHNVDHCNDHGFYSQQSLLRSDLCLEKFHPFNDWHRLCFGFVTLVTLYMLYETM